MTTKILDECKIATKSLRRVFNMLDVDGLLTEKNEIFEKMIYASATLLEEARYDAENGIKWARQDAVV